MKPMNHVRIVGVGKTKIGRLNAHAAQLAGDAIGSALADAGMKREDLRGLVGVPSLSDPPFMQAHYIATLAGLLPHKDMVVRTVDTGGAGPISALATATAIISNGWAETVAVVASDAVLSLPSAEFLRRADEGVGGGLPSPAIPHGYDLVAQWQMQQFGVTREQLAMVSVLMSWQASRHPDAMCKGVHKLEDVLNARPIAPVTGLFECARRADGAGALILSSSHHFERNFRKSLSQCPVVLATGEASGPLPLPTDITPEMFSCERAAEIAYDTAQLGPRDIGFFGLYDCFPICFLRALEAAGVCKPGEGGTFIEQSYKEMLAGTMTTLRSRSNLTACNTPLLHTGRVRASLSCSGRWRH